MGTAIWSDQKNAFIHGDKLQINMAEKYLRESEKLAWKRPISRTYEFNLQLGENYYSPQTLYLDQKAYAGHGQIIPPPGALTMSERLFLCPVRGRTSVNTVTSSNSYFSHSSSRTFIA